MGDSVYQAHGLEILEEAEDGFCPVGDADEHLQRRCLNQATMPGQKRDFDEALSQPLGTPTPPDRDAL